MRRDLLRVTLLLIIAVAAIGLASGATVERPDMGDEPVVSQVATGSFSENSYRVVRGETAQITFDHSDSGTLYVGGDDVGYRLQVDVSGTGPTSISLDTYQSASANPDSYVEGGDATLLYPDGGLKEALAPGKYRLNLTVDGVKQDLGQLVITERPEPSVETRIASHQLDVGSMEYDSLIENSNRGSSMAYGDYLLVELTVPGFGEAINTDDLRGGRSANGIGLVFEETDPPANDDPQSFAVSAGDPAFQTYWQEDTSSMLVVWDTNDRADSRIPQTYNITLELTAEYNALISADRVPASTTARVEQSKINLQTGDGQLDMYPWESDVVPLEGRTNYAPGTTFQFRAEGYEPSPYFKKESTTVSSDGTFGTEMDFGNAARGVEIPVWILDYRDEATWTIERPESEASLRFTDQLSEDGRTVVIQNAAVSMQGFVVLETAGGEIVGVSEAIERPNGERVSLTLQRKLKTNSTLKATAYIDKNLNDSFEAGTDETFTTNGETVSTTATVSIPASMVRDVTTEAPAPTPDETTTTAATPTPTETTPAITTLEVRTQEPLTPKTSGGTADLSPMLVLVAIGIVGFVLGRRSS